MVILFWPIGGVNRLNFKPAAKAPWSVKAGGVSMAEEIGTNIKGQITNPFSLISSSCIYIIFLFFFLVIRGLTFCFLTILPGGIKRDVSARTHNIYIYIIFLGENIREIVFRLFCPAVQLKTSMMCLLLCTLLRIPLRNCYNLLCSE